MNPVPPAKRYVSLLLPLLYPVLWCAAGLLSILNCLLPGLEVVLELVYYLRGRQISSATEGVSVCTVIVIDHEKSLNGDSCPFRLSTTCRKR